MKETSGLELARARASALRARWRDAGGEAEGVPDAVAAGLDRVFMASDFVAESLIREPAMLRELATGEIQRARDDGEYRAMLGALLDAEAGEAEFMDRLRRLRRRELVRIAWRDLTGLAQVTETLVELSELGDSAVIAAVDFARSSLAPAFGQPRSRSGASQELVVVGMGKLGGRELNFSSDIDLVFLYPEAGETDGPRRLENEEYFTRLVQKLIRLLDARTAEGFVFRIDTRLRPFGDAGPMVVNFDAFDAYLQMHGRDWERYAYVKARAVTGTGVFERLFEATLRPFVYRRYLDYGVFESLRDMKDMIAREVTRRDLLDDIKLGPGGIREIEFIVQAHQLIRGGSEPGLQSTSLLTALPRLAGAKVLRSEVVAQLREAYEFLRRVENRLQMSSDQQTHRLPADDLGRQRLAAAMGHTSWDEFAGRLELQRRVVTAHFDDVVIGRARGFTSTAASQLEALWSTDPSPEQVVSDLTALGIRDAASAARLLLELRASSYYRRLDEYGRRRLATLLPRLLAAIVESAAGTSGAELPVLTRLLRIVETIGGRTAYLALLNENAQALSRLIRICAVGDYLPRQIAAHPLLLDELLDSRIFDSLPDRSQFRRELAIRLEHAGDDAERQIDALREFRRAAIFRIATHDLTGRLPVMEVSDRLTDVAELILGEALGLAWRQSVAIHGAPRCVDAGGARAVRVGIAGYGKLGGMELGYGSDLDLVFLHDSAGEQQQTSGPRTVDNVSFLMRLAQRLVHLLTVHTSAGRLYEVDVRLRPAGKGGLAFTSIRAFEEYQRRDAWTWEHQALLHSRWVAGDEQLGAEYARIRREALAVAVRRETLRADIVAMRERMRSEHATTRQGFFDLKQDRGGITDVEFMAQYWVLRWAGELPPLAEFADTIRHLESIGSAALVDHRTIDRLVDAYRRYREAAHHRSLEQQPPLVPAAEFAAERGDVAAIWQRVMVAGVDPRPL